MQEAGWLTGHWCCSLLLLPDGWERSTPPGVPESGLRAVCMSEPHSWVESLLPCPAGFLGYRFWATEDDFFSGWGLESGLGPFFGHQPGSKDLERDPTEGHPCPASSSLPRKASELLGGASIFWVPLPGFPPPFYLAVKRKEVLGVPVAAQQFKNLTCCILVSLRM